MWGAGWVTVGQDHDTASFAVASLRRWWEVVGQPSYPQAPAVLICADGGGSNGSRVRLWKVELQQFATETGLTVTVCDLPPGTSKWNTIEHRFFAHISLKGTQATDWTMSYRNPPGSQSLQFSAQRGAGPPAARLGVPSHQELHS